MQTDFYLYGLMAADTNDCLCPSLVPNFEFSVLTKKSRLSPAVQNFISIEAFLKLHLSQFSTCHVTLDPLSKF